MLAELIFKGLSTFLVLFQFRGKKKFIDTRKAVNSVAIIYSQV